MELMDLMEDLQMVEDHNLIPIDINIDFLEVISMLTNVTSFIMSLLMNAGQN